MSPRLDHHALTDIRLRFDLRETRRGDVEALLAEVDQLRDDLRQVAAEFDANPNADPDELVRIIREGRADDQEAAAQVREYEAFERGCSTLLRAYRGDERVSELLHRPPLANASEFCAVCSSWNADDHDLCARHGKKVRQFWTEAEGPTQTGLVHLLVFVLPLVDVLRRVPPAQETCGIGQEAAKCPLRHPAAAQARRSPSRLPKLVRALKTPRRAP